MQRRRGDGVSQSLRLLVADRQPRGKGTGETVAGAVRKAQSSNSCAMPPASAQAPRWVAPFSQRWMA